MIANRGGDFHVRNRNSRHTEYDAATAVGLRLNRPAHIVHKSIYRQFRPSLISVNFSKSYLKQAGHGPLNRENKGSSSHFVLFLNGPRVATKAFILGTADSCAIVRRDLNFDMPVVQATDDFLTVLRKSEIIDADELSLAISQYGLSAKSYAGEVADTLVNKNFLTRFQADRMLQGEYRDLVIDNYKVLYMLGSGGMGYVYAAQEPDSSWKVALKVLSENLQNDRGAVARFQLEAQAGLRINHPNIVRTIGIKKVDNIYGSIHYVVMELVQGVSLVELLEIRRPISYQRAADIICQVAEGLDHSHNQGLIHRDIKPENLLIRSNGSVKILDFGLAMLDENGEEFSMAMIHGQNCVGTADFIAPEQSVDSYRIDQRADIYSLGCTFYSALTCKVPFPTKSVAEKLEAHRTKHPKPVQELRPDVPDRLAKILRKMMAKRPEDRFSNCAEVVEYLKPFAKRKEIEFDFDKVLEKRSRRAERRRLKRLLEQQSGVTSGSSITGSAIADKLRQSGIETVVSKDTRRLDREDQTDAPPAKNDLDT